MPILRSELFPDRPAQAPQRSLAQRELSLSLADSMEENPDAFQLSDEVGPNQFSSNVALTTRTAAQRARSELFNNRRKIAQQGLSGAYKDFRQEEKDTMISSTWDSVADLLSIGNYTAAGAALTYARTGSAYEAFRQAASEFGNALPVLNEDTMRSLGLPAPKRETFSQGLPTFLEKGAARSDRWLAAGVGLVLDIFGDPTTYIVPGNAIRKIAATKGGQEVSALMRQAGKALRPEEGWVDNTAALLGRAFIPHYDIKRLEQRTREGRGISLEGVEHLVQGADRFDPLGLKSGEGAAQTLALATALGRAQLQGVARNVDEQVRRLMANTTESEQVLLGSLLDQPEVLETQLKKLVDMGGLGADRVPFILEKAAQARKVYTELFEQEAKSGVVSHSIFREDYLYGTSPVNQRSSRMFEQFIKERGIERKFPEWEKADRDLLASANTPGFTKHKTYNTIEERINDGIPTELNFGLGLAKRGFHSARSQATRTLFNTVLTNPEMAMRVTDDIGEEGWAQLRRRGLEKFALKDGGQELAYALPKEVAETLNRYQTKWQQPQELAGILKVTDWLTSMWKGSAVLSPGFHIRNVMGQVFHDWGAGIGKPRQEGASFLSVRNLPGSILRLAENLTGKKDYQTANYIKLRSASMALLDGPDWLQAKLTADWGGFSPRQLAESLQITKPGTKDVMSLDELKDELHRFGIVDPGWSGITAAEELSDATTQGVAAAGRSRQFWDALVGKTPAATPVPAAAIGQGVNPLAQFATQQAGQVSVGEALRPLFGANNPLYRANRSVGRFLENQARTTHYLDRRLRGWTPEKARQSVVKWHFDYSELTDFEQQAMRRVLPFYCVPDDCEMLTRQGWKTVDQLVVGEEVYALNHDRGEAEWVPLEDVATFDYDGPMLALRGNRDDFVFTPDHRWPVIKSWEPALSPRREIVRGYQLHTGHKIPRTARFVGQGDEAISPRMAAIVGWVVTDGYTRDRGTCKEVIIYQSPSHNPGNVKKILDLLGDHASVRNPHPTSGVLPISVIGTLRKEIAALIPDGKKSFPAFCASLTREAAAACLSSMMDAEGSTGHEGEDKEHTHFSQQDGDVLDGFQILAQLTGQLAHKSKRGAYLCRSFVNLKVAEILTEDQYKGRIWCPKTKHGTWLMRRKGRVIWTGNTWSRKNIPLMLGAIATNPGRYAQIDKMKTAIESLSPEWADIGAPDYYQETQAVRLPIALNKQPLYWQPELPFLDVNRLKLRDALASAHPLLTLPFEMTTGESLFTGQPIERYTGELAKGRLGDYGVSKETQYIASKILPTAGLLDRTLLRGEDTQSLEPLGFSTLNFGGLKVRPLDVSKERLNKIFQGRRASRNFLQRVREERERARARAERLAEEQRKEEEG